MRMRGCGDMMSTGIVRSADMGIRKMDLGVEMRGYDVQGGLTLDKQIWGKKDGLGHLAGVVRTVLLPAGSTVGKTW